MNKKVLIGVGAIACTPLIIIFLIIAIVVSSFSAILGGGATENINTDGYKFNNLPFLADYYTCTSDYGGRTDPTGISGSFHFGVDLVAFKKDGSKDVPIVAVVDGVVAEITDVSSGAMGGNSIRIYNQELGLYFQTAHMKYPIEFKVGDKIKQGDVLGIQGTTGNSTGVHTHFQIDKKENGRYVHKNPRDYFDLAKPGEFRQIDNTENKNDNMKGDNENEKNETD